MAWFTRSSHTTILSVALTLGLAVNLPAHVQAQPLNSLSSQLPAEWTPPTGTGAPVNLESGGRRGPDDQGPNQCVQNQEHLIALVPDSGVAATTAEYPTFYWYMPTTNAPVVEFTLKDAKDQLVYSARYDLSQSSAGAKTSSGLMSLKLPSSANVPPLKIGEQYKWELALKCTFPDSSADIYVQGGIQRVALDPTMMSRLEQATPKERVSLYAQETDWYETVRNLVELRQNFPNDQEVTQAWNKLLHSVGLEEVSQSAQQGVISQLPASALMTN